MESIEDILARVKLKLVKRDEDMPRQFRYKCLACLDNGVENYISPEDPMVLYARPCKHCLIGQKKLKIWRARKWQSNIDGRPIPIVYRSGTDAEIAEVMAYPCDHDPLPSEKP